MYAALDGDDFFSMHVALIHWTGCRMDGKMNSDLNSCFSLKYEGVERTVNDGDFVSSIPQKAIQRQ